MSCRRCFIASEDGLLYSSWENVRLTVSGVELAPPLNYLAADWNGKRLYATARCEICAFDLSEDRPRLLYKTSCMGDVACHLCLSPDRQSLFCANYISGNIAVFRILDRSFEFIQSITGHGHCGNDRKRQDGPHAHCCAFIDGNLWAADLGQDAIFIFPWDGEKLGSEIGRIAFPFGSGPRHFVHDASHNRICCVSELSNELFIIDSGNLNIQYKKVIARPKDALSAIRLSPGRTTLGIGIRGSDQVILLDSVDLHTQFVVNSGEICVRDFAVPDNETICICGQDSSSVSFFRTSGKSAENRIQQIEVPKPMCVLFEPAVDHLMYDHRKIALQARDLAI